MIGFCTRYLQTAADVAGLGKWFLIVALAAGALYAAVEVWKRFVEKAPTGGAAIKGAATGQPVKDLADALRELVATLAAAPVWLALMSVGLLTFALVGAAIPAQCEMLGKKVVTATAPAAKPALVPPADPTGR